MYVCRDFDSGEFWAPVTGILQTWGNTRSLRIVKARHFEILLFELCDSSPEQADLVRLILRWLQVLG